MLPLLYKRLTIHILVSARLLLGDLAKLLADSAARAARDLAALDQASLIVLDTCLLGSRAAVAAAVAEREGGGNAERGQHTERAEAHQEACAAVVATGVGSNITRGAREAAAAPQAQGCTESCEGCMTS